MKSKHYTWMSQKLKENQSPLGGWGTYTKEKVSKDDLLMIFGGYIMSFEEESHLPKDAQDLAIQIEQSFVIGRKTKAELRTGDFVNHSCEPNSGIRGQISLYAMRDIESGEEITFDYGSVLYTPQDAPVYELPCLCLKSTCRKNITSNDWMTRAIRTMDRKYVPFYISDAIEKFEVNLNK